MTVLGRSLTLLLAGAAVILALAAGHPPEASAQCIVSVDYLGASYFGRGQPLAPADVGGPAGRGSVPGCNDVVTDPPLDRKSVV